MIRLPLHSKLLIKNVSISQFLAYGLAALVGMTILFAGFRLWQDVQPLFATQNALFKDDFFIVNKKVGLMSVFSSQTGRFSKAQVRSISEQNFVKSVSAFTPSQYSVMAYAKVGGQSFSTDLFFESLPNKFIHTQQIAWEWKPGDTTIPIILPRDYLNLYNFGFAASRGLPQMSESLIRQLSFNIRLQGNGQVMNFEGRIIDFSSSLNTILVPESFMQWSNAQLGNTEESGEIARLIVEPYNATDPAIATYFASKNYEISSSQENNSKQAYLLKYLIMMVMGIGLLVLLPAIGFMLICINLLLYKNQATIAKLIAIGFHQKQLVVPYAVLMLIINVVVGVVAFTLSWLIQQSYQKQLSNILDSAQSSAGLLSFLFAFGFVIVISGLNIWWIHRKIKFIE